MVGLFHNFLAVSEASHPQSGRAVAPASIHSGGQPGSLRIGDQHPTVTALIEERSLEVNTGTRDGKYEEGAFGQIRDLLQHIRCL